MRNRFNGAVLHQHGRPGRFSRRSIRAVRTSMGPCFISTEDFRTMRRGCPALTSFNGAVLHQHGRPSAGTVQPSGRDTLQWGRASSARKTGPGVARPVAGDDASMGPCFISTEDNISVTLSRWLPTLQWGRASSARKTPWTCDKAIADAHASMGPCFISTEDVMLVSLVSTSVSRFNGAVLHQHGRHFSYDAVAQQKQRRLQWGRASSARKTAPRRFSYRL